MNRSIGTFAAVAAVALCACSKEAPKTDSAAVAQAGVGAPATAAGSYDPTTRVATIIAKDFVFLAPDSIQAGWTTFRMVNEGPTLHHLQIVRLDSGKTPADAAALMKTPGPSPAWFVAVGGPNAVDPKSESNATLNLKAGNYIMLCFIDIPDKVMHLNKGMAHAFTVTPSAVAGTAPAADVTIALSDYAFTVQGGAALTAGKHTFKIVNNGPQEHEIEIIRLAPGKTTKDFGIWIQKFEGPPPASGIGGVAGLAKGLDGYLTVDLTPGNYAFLCFVPAPDGKLHLEHGMLKEFTVN